MQSTIDMWYSYANRTDKIEPQLVKITSSYIRNCTDKIEPQLVNITYSYIRKRGKITRGKTARQGVFATCSLEMSQSDQLFVFASIVLSNDHDRMPTCFLLLHECAHVLWHSALVKKVLCLKLPVSLAEMCHTVLRLSDLSSSLFFT